MLYAGCSLQDVAWTVTPFDFRVCSAIYKTNICYSWYSCCLITLRQMSALFWVFTQRVVVIYYRRFGTTYRYHPQGSRITHVCVFLHYHMECYGHTYYLLTFSFVYSFVTGCTRRVLRFVVVICKFCSIDIQRIDKGYFSIVSGLFLIFTFLSLGVQRRNRKTCARVWEAGYLDIVGGDVGW